VVARGNHDRDLGLHPAYTLGALADRNHVAARDFSALTPPHRR